jgi:hypothetical protein
VGEREGEVEKGREEEREGRDLSYLSIVARSSDMWCSCARAREEEDCS